MSNFIETTNDIISLFSDGASLTDAVNTVAKKPNADKDVIAIFAAAITIGSFIFDPNTGRGTLFGSIGFFLEAGKLAIEVSDNNFTIDDLAAGAGVVGAALARVPNPLAQVWSKYFIALSIAPATGRAIAGVIPLPDEIDRIADGIYKSLQDTWAPIAHFANDFSKINAIDNEFLQADLFVLMMQYYANKDSAQTAELFSWVGGGIQFNAKTFAANATELTNFSGYTELKKWILAQSPQDNDTRSIIANFLQLPSRISLPINTTDSVTTEDNQNLGNVRDFMLAGTEWGNLSGGDGDDLLVSVINDEYFNLQLTA